MATLRNDRAYTAKRDALKRRARREGSGCHLCGKPIDYTLDYRHPMAFTADHIDAVGAGGSMTGPLEPAHRSCNSRRGKKPLVAVKRAQKPITSRAW